MRALEETKNVLRTALAGLSSVVAVWLTEELGPDKLHVFHNTFLLWATAAVIIMLGVVFLGPLLDKGVERSALLRSRLLKDDNIEGLWCDVSEEPETGRIAHVAIFRVYYDEGDFKVSGSSYDGSGKRLAIWHSLITGYSERTLKYVYSSQTLIEPEKGVEQGYAQLTFGLPPNSYNGEYHAFDGRVAAHVGGERITKERCRQFDGLADDSSCARFVRELAAAQPPRSRPLSLVPDGRSSAARKRRT
jgi:hypothetical protein